VRKCVRASLACRLSVLLLALVSPVVALGFPLLMDGYERWMLKQKATALRR
jgi:hypothetical protein